MKEDWQEQRPFAPKSPKGDLDAEFSGCRKSPLGDLGAKASSSIYLLY